MPTVAMHDGDPPRVAIYSAWNNTQEIGWYRDAFDKFGIPYDLIFKERVKKGNLKADYDEAGKFAQAIGYPALMGRAAEAVQGLSDGFIAAGFSNGGGMAEFVATVRPVRGVLMFSGALALDMIGVDAWPAGVPAQIHYTAEDPFRNQEAIDAVAAQVSSAGASVEVFDYPGKGHLFTAGADKIRAKGAMGVG